MPCEICCEEFNSSVNKKITCGHCDINVCRKCVKIYLLSTTSSPHCMSCKNSWDKKFTQTSLTISFYNGKYNNHRKNILFEREKARFPETMAAVEDYKNIKNLEATNIKLIIETVRLEYEIENKQKKLSALNRQISENNVKIVEAKKGKRTSDNKSFIRRCPVNNCKGYLSNKWKCGLCNIWACHKCFAVKGTEKNCEHKCNADDLASAKLIKKETRSCPGCGNRIYKISGCDQMWCTGCHVAFSWETGMKVKGVIHNPHFYAFQRQGGGAVIRNPGAQICGGIPTYLDFRDTLNYLKNTSTYKNGVKKIMKNIAKNNDEWDRYIGGGTLRKGMRNTLEHIHRGAAHMQHAIINDLREKCQGEIDNEDLRIKFMCDEIDENQMKKILMKRDKAYEKNKATLDIYELVGAVNTEHLINIINIVREFNRNYNYNWDNETPEQKEQAFEALKNLFESIHYNIMEINRVRKYCNIELCKISEMYNQSVYLINCIFETPKFNKKMCVEELKKGDYCGNLYIKAENTVICRTERGRCIYV